jgi:ATP-binding cassette subfamily B protein
MSTLKKLQQYAGSRKALFPLSMSLSAISELAGILPCIFKWLILREILTAGREFATQKII